MNKKTKSANSWLTAADSHGSAAAYQFSGRARLGALESELFVDDARFRERAKLRPDRLFLWADTPEFRCRAYAQIPHPRDRVLLPTRAQR